MTEDRKVVTIETIRKGRILGMASSVIGRLDSQVDKIFFQKGLSRSVEEQERLEKMSPEERESYLKEKKEREDDIVLY